MIYVVGAGFVAGQLLGAEVRGAAVLAGGSFTNGGGFSLALTSSGVLYVLDGNAATLFRVDP